MIDKLLKEFDACKEARRWAKGKSWQEIYETCNRGDRLLWLFAKTNPDDKRLLTLAKGHCVNTVRHLMKDERSIKAVDAAIAFGEGKVDEEELKIASSSAYAAASASSSAATYAATYAAAHAAAHAAAAAYAATYAAVYAVAYAAHAAAAAYAAAHAAAAAYAASAASAVASSFASSSAAASAAYAVAVAYDADAKVENELLTANIVRKYIPIELWNIEEQK